MFIWNFCQEKSKKNFCRKDTRCYILNPFAKISYSQEHKKTPKEFGNSWELIMFLHHDVQR